MDDKQHTEAIGKTTKRPKARHNFRKGEYRHDILPDYYIAIYDYRYWPFFVKKICGGAIIHWYQGSKAF